MSLTIRCRFPDGSVQRYPAINSSTDLDGALALQDSHGLQAELIEVVDSSGSVLRVLKDRHGSSPRNVGGRCKLVPRGWRCKQPNGHGGPCPAYPVGWTRLKWWWIFHRA